VTLSHSWKKGAKASLQILFSVSYSGTSAGIKMIECGGELMQEALGSVLNMVKTNK
jgi:hypothetical protein